jgi:hypothetical protein
MMQPQRTVDRLPRRCVSLIGKTLQPLDAGKERQHSDTRVNLEVPAGPQGGIGDLAKNTGYILTGVFQIAKIVVS